LPRAERGLQPMYTNHFGLREPPFNNTPDPRFFYATAEHEEALATLIYAVGELKGYVLLTGEVGTGKTLITRMLLRHFGNRITSAVIHNTCLDADDLLAAICSEFDLEVSPGATRFDRVRVLQDYLLSEFAANRPVVLVLDEAQNLSLEAFEQLRMIGNLEADDTKLLQVIIAGQPELRQRFEADNLRQLRQRIFRGFHLPALSREQCERYIRHRLAVAGGLQAVGAETEDAPKDTVGPFSAEAIDRVFAYSQGLPRLVNTACDNAMLSAYAADRDSIEGAFMGSVLDQMAAGGGTGASPAASSGLGRTTASALAASEHREATAAPRHGSNEAGIPGQAVPGAECLPSSATASTPSPTSPPDGAAPAEQDKTVKTTVREPRRDSGRPAASSAHPRRKADAGLCGASAARRPLTGNAPHARATADRTRGRAGGSATKTTPIAVPTPSLLKKSCPPRTPPPSDAGADRLRPAARPGPAGRSQAATPSVQLRARESSNRLRRLLDRSRCSLDDLRSLVDRPAAGHSPSDGPRPTAAARLLAANRDRTSATSELARRMNELVDIADESAVAV